MYEGTWKYIQGTDRFAGIEGSGSFTGKNFTPPDVVYVDYTGTYTLPRPGTAALAPGEFIASKVEDLVGIWETRGGGAVAYWQFEADGTLNVAPTVEMLEKRWAMISGTFWFEGTVFHMKDNHVSPTGTYEVRVQEEKGKPIHLSFTVIDDPVTGRVRELTAGMSRVEL